MKKTPKPVYIAITAALSLAPLGCFGATDSKPNVLILLVDDMGYGDPHCFNPESKIATPNIDRLAQEGMRFTDAHAAASICVPSRYGLLTGQMPYRNWNAAGISRAQRFGRSELEMRHFPQPQLQQEPGRLNLASLMKRQGYATACIGKWHQGLSSKSEPDGTLKITPVDFGFDYYFGFDAPEQGPYAFIENKRFVVEPTEMIEDHPGEDVTNPETQGRHWRKGLAAPGWKFEEYLQTIGSKADAWLEKQSGHPFFLYYAVPAPHAPWATANQFKGQSGAGQYGDYVMNVDAMVGQVMMTLDKLKLKENTLVYFSSDNGPVWYAADIARFGHHASGPWNGMKGALMEGGHHMPFIARWPGHIQPGSTCGELICFTDLLATQAAMLGEKLPADAAEDSFDISPLLRSETPAQPIRTQMVHVNYSTYTLAIREGDWKLILPTGCYQVKDGAITPDQISGSRGKSDLLALFNLRSDPGEVTNLAASHPEKARELFAALKADLARGRSRP